MKNPDKEPLINIEQVSDKVDTLVSQLGKIEERKAALFKILNESEEIVSIFWKMKAGKIITLKESIIMNDFIWIGDIKIWESDKGIFFNGILDGNIQESDLANFIGQYPLVVDADKIDDDNAEWWLIPVIKNYMTMFIQIIKDNEGAPSIIYCSDAYTWSPSLPKNDPDNKELLEIENCNQTIFLQKEVDPSWVLHIQKIADLAGEHPMPFDKDNLAVLYKENSMFSIIHKSELANWKFQVKEVLLFKKPSWVAIKFDEYNSFEAEHPKIGKVICRKRYNDWWELLWIDTFKKQILWSEKRINSQCRSIDWLTGRE